MKWTKLTLQTTTEAVEYIGVLLEELGIFGMEIEDHVPISEEDRKRLFIDFLPELPADDKTAAVSFYVEEGGKLSEVVNGLRAGLAELARTVPIGSGVLTLSETEDLDWINNWKQFFKAFSVGETLLIRPSWETADETQGADISCGTGERLVLEIDPGTAFGTGSHETTKLCLLALEDYLRPKMRVLDLGCGSGILSILAAKRGAAVTVGIDIDEHAVRISKENAIVNQLRVSEAFDESAHRTAEEANAETEPLLSFAAGDVLTDESLRARLASKPYDIVVANILADVIIPLSAFAGAFLREGGLFITSGIIDTKQAAVIAAAEKNGFVLQELREMGDWSCIIFTWRAETSHRSKS